MPSVLAPGHPAEQHPSAQARFGYLTPKQAAGFTNISVQELERLRRVGGGPRFCVPSGRLVRYAVLDLCDWLDSFKVGNTSEARELPAQKGVSRAA